MHEQRQRVPPTLTQSPREINCVDLFLAAYGLFCFCDTLQITTGEHVTNRCHYFEGELCIAFYHGNGGITTVFSITAGLSNGLLYFIELAHGAVLSIYVIP